MAADVIRTRRAGPFAYTEAAHQAGPLGHPLEEDAARLVLVLKGTLRVHAGGEHVKCCRAMDTVLERTAGRGQVRVEGSGARCLHVTIEPSWAEAVLSAPAADTDVAGEAVLLRDASLVRRLYREFSEPDAASALALEGLTLELVAHLSRVASAPASSPPRLTQAVALIHERFTEELSLRDVALAVGWHPVQLARQFRRANRCSVGQYIRTLRVEWACAEIDRGGAPLSEIASRAGFADQSHFTRTFKRLTGTTPARYRVDSLQRVS